MNLVKLGEKTWVRIFCVIFISLLIGNILLSILYRLMTPGTTRSFIHDCIVGFEVSLAVVLNIVWQKALMAANSDSNDLIIAE